MTFAPALPTADYTVMFGAGQGIAGGTSLILNVQSSANGQTVSALDIRSVTVADNVADPVLSHSVAVLCSGE